jgi:hypothetical protein
VGVKTNTPQAALDVNGRIKMSDDNTNPVKGTIRWNENSKDFEGFNGTEWLSLTLSNMQNTGWQQPGQPNGSVTNITQHPSPSTSNDTRFGGSVSIDSNYAVVGAPEESSNGANDGGAAYIYRTTDNGNTWSMVARIVAPNNPDLTPDKFGFSVAVSGNIVAVGAPYRNDGRGRIFIYRTTDNGNTWPLTAELFQNSINDNANLGSAIDLDSNLLVAGVSGTDEPVLPGNPNPIQDGAVFVFKTTDNGNTWNSTKLNSTGIVYQSGSLVFSSHFGSSVSIGDNVLLAEAPFFSYSEDDRSSGGIAFYRTADNGTTWTRNWEPGTDGYTYLGKAVSNLGESKIYNLYRPDLNDPFVRRLYFFYSQSNGLMFSDANNPFTGAIPRLFGQGDVANTHQLNYVVWRIENVTTSCNTPVSGAKGLVRVFKNNNGEYVDYFHITDPTVLLTDNNYLDEINVACYGDRFLIGVPYAGLSDKGKVIFGKIK